MGSDSRTARFRVNRRGNCSINSYVLWVSLSLSFFPLCTSSAARRFVESHCAAQIVLRKLNFAETGSARAGRDNDRRRLIQSPLRTKCFSQRTRAHVPQTLNTRFARGSFPLPRAYIHTCARSRTVIETRDGRGKRKKNYQLTVTYIPSTIRDSSAFLIPLAVIT